MIKIDPIVEKAVGFVGRNSTTILTGAGIASFMSSIAFAIKSTRTAGWVYEKASDEAMYMDAPKIKKAAHVAKAVVPLYIPTIVSAGVGTACVIFANKINLDDKAALIAACSMYHDGLKTYQEKVVERLGDGAHEEIMEAIASEDADILETVDREDIPGHGDTLIYDHVTGRYFLGDKHLVEQAEAHITKKLMDEATARINDFYEALGLEDISNVGDALGWDASRCTLDIRYSSMLDENGRPCLVINYDVCLVSGHILRDTTGRYWG